MASVSGKELSPFFDQWLFHGGHPIFSATWQYDKQLKELKLIVEQTQKGTIFQFPLEIACIDKSGKREIKTVQIDSKQAKINLKADFEPVELVIDPNTWLLFEGTIQKK